MTKVYRGPTGLFGWRWFGECTICQLRHGFRREANARKWTRHHVEVFDHGTRADRFHAESEA